MRMNSPIEKQILAARKFRDALIIEMVQDAQEPDKLRAAIRLPEMGNTEKWQEMLSLLKEAGIGSADITGLAGVKGTLAVLTKKYLSDKGEDGSIAGIGNDVWDGIVAYRAYCEEQSSLIHLPLTDEATTKLIKLGANHGSLLAAERLSSKTPPLP